MVTIGWKRCLLGFVALAILAGCGREFDPYYRANKFRLLAVKSSEPLLEPGETAELTALVYDPDRDGETTYKWEWCPFRTSASQEYECPVTEEELAEQLLGDQVPPGFMLPLEDFELGTEPTASLPYPAPQPVIIEFCNALQEALDDAPEELASLIPVVDCSRGFEISVRLIVERNGSRIVAGKRIALAVPDVQPNENPDVVDIQIRPGENEDPAALRALGLDWIPNTSERDQLWYTLPADESTPLLSNVEWDFRSVVDPESVEIWSQPAPDGLDVEFLPPESEVIAFRWFVSGGALLEDSSPIYLEGANELLSAGDTIYTRTCEDDASSSDCDNDGVPDSSDNCVAFPNDDQADFNADGIGDACDHRVFSVIRDGRLGLDYISRDFHIVGDNR